MGFWQNAQLSETTRLFLQSQKGLPRLQRVGAEFTEKAEETPSEPEFNPLVQPRVANIGWSMSFMEDRPVTGRRFRTLNILGDFK